MRAFLILAVLPSALLRAQVVVGPNVQISKAFPRLPHYENLAAGDPDHVGRLVACATVAHEDLAGQGDHCYVSFDSGKSWTTVLELDKGPRNSDPAMTYGRGDTVFIVNEYIPSPGFGAMTMPGMEQNRMHVYRSPDGGKTWSLSASFPFIDREAIVVDETDGSNAGRIYMSGVTKGYFAPGGPSSALLYRSVDGGSTFIGPVERPTSEGGNLLGASNIVVLSDGTVAFATIHVKKDRNENVLDENNPRTANAELQLLTSSDGGQSFNPWTTVGDWWLDMESAQGAEIAMLAVDPGSPFFKDRLYAVWPSAPSGRHDIFFAYSRDKGKTWSSPLKVNDDRPPVSPENGPDHIMPAVGVNKLGAVLVTWFDRRDSGDNIGWNVRAAASLDGGVTFTPSVVISEAANVFTDRTPVVLGAPGISGGGTQRPGAARGRPLSVNLGVNGFFLNGGDTDGIAVGADDVFHAFWVDNRTGVSQFWTAPVTVRGTVERNGARELADLEEMTDRLTLDARATSFDRLTGTLTFTARLRNTSKEIVRAPLKARVTHLSAQLGVPSIVGATSGATGVGAIWDWSVAIPATGLLPDSSSAARTLRFHLSNLRPIRRPRQSGGGLSGLVRFETRIYGAKSSGANGGAPKSSAQRAVPGDVRFMQAMIAHHGQAVVMAALVPARTGRRDMRLLAERIDVSQRDEISMMQDWLRARGETVPQAMAEHHHLGASDMTALMPGMLTDAELAELSKASGAAFERLFLTFMIRHHEGALEMVKALFASPGAGQDSDIFRFASDVDTDQTAEIVRMRSMLADMLAKPQ